MSAFFHGKSHEVQGKLIAESFEDWKGSNPQLDDECVIGVRIQELS